MARKQITFTNMIPIDNIYYPTNDLTEAEREAAQRYTEQPVKAERIASDKLAEWAEKAADKVSKALSSYYSSHVEEFKGV